MTERGASGRRQCGCLTKDGEVMHFAVTKDIKLLGDSDLIPSGVFVKTNVRHQSVLSLQTYATSPGALNLLEKTLLSVIQTDSDVQFLSTVIR